MCACARTPVAVPNQLQLPRQLPAASPVRAAIPALASRPPCPAVPTCSATATATQNNKYCSMCGTTNGQRLVCLASGTVCKVRRAGAGRCQGAARASSREDSKALCRQRPMQACPFRCPADRDRHHQAVLRQHAGPSLHHRQPHQRLPPLAHQRRAAVRVQGPADRRGAAPGWHHYLRRPRQAPARPSRPRSCPRPCQRQARTLACTAAGRDHLPPPAPPTSPPCAATGMTCSAANTPLNIYCAHCSGNTRKLCLASGIACTVSAAQLAPT